MRWVDFVHDEFSRVDSEISAFMTGFDRAVTVDLGAAGRCGEHAGIDIDIDILDAFSTWY